MVIWLKNINEVKTTPAQSWQRTPTSERTLMTIPDDCSSGEPRSGVAHAMYWGRTPGAIPLGSRKFWEFSRENLCAILPNR